MLARVVKWEGGDADSIRAATQEIATRSASGPPEGVPATGFTLLADADGGAVIGIGLFETQEDLDAGAAMLNAMTPPNEGMGDRTSVDVYEVVVDTRAE